ncbi:MAG: BON domain-containing protein [Rubricoccaceae bacterium]|nr:BON domain-containing protein [Rubricoccaceae bacterium]
MHSVSPSKLGALSPSLRNFLNRLQERKIRTSVDRELARRVRAAVEGTQIDVNGLSVYVHDGSIALYGSIKSESVRESLLSTIARQPGARRIADHLQLMEG